MIYKNLFVDSDVLLDLLLQREPFSDYTKLLMIQKKAGSLNLNTSTLIIANINYILSKKMNKAKVMSGIKGVIKLINILPFEVDAINSALDSDFIDFEDAIQHSIAQKHQCDAIISRNIKGYKQSTIPVFTAEQFLRTL